MDSESSRPGGVEVSAMALFGRWVADRQQGRARPFEELCAAHPELAELLRPLHDEVLRIDDMLAAGGASGVLGPDQTALSDRLAGKFGSEVNPSVALETEPEADKDFAGAVLERLSGRAGNSGRYRLKGEVGRGGMGAVLRVWDEDLRRHLAMKGRSAGAC